MKADLHLHSIYSDGENIPAQIAEQAKLAGAEIIALTDHDTVKGVPEMQREAEKLGLKVLTGIEVSSFMSCEVHILGYNVDISDSKFLKKLEDLRIMRIRRLELMIEKLNNIGIPITFEEAVAGINEISSVGRMHIARALIKKGVAAKYSEVFDRWLGYGKVAYVESQRLLPSEAIELIQNAGGKAVLAHPSVIDIAPQILPAMVGEFVRCGLDGIEAVYSAHTTEENRYYTKLGEEYGLIITCGSDFHGTSRDSEIFGYELSEENYQRLTSRN